nr:hypothetical protein B7L51_01270 [Pectobacterium carotovorum]
MNFESMLAAKDAPNWGYWVMIAACTSAVMSLLGVIATVWALLVARKGLNSWKDQHISLAKGEWIASLTDYSAGVSYLPHTISWDNPNDKDHVEKAASLLYECVKKWKVLQVHLENNPELKAAFNEKYESHWADFGTTKHNGYMSGAIRRDVLKDSCIALYNL